MSNEHPSIPPRGRHWRLVPMAAVALLALFAVLCITSMAGKSQTFDEGMYLCSGYARFITRGADYQTVHPPLFQSLCTLPLLFMDPKYDDARTLGWEERGIQFLYRLNPRRAEQMLFRGRLVAVAAGVALCLLVFLWMRRAAGPAVALLALFFCVTDPNLLAHARLATGDIFLTLLACLTMYLFGNALERPAARRWLVAGIVCGLALATKHVAGLLIPALIIMTAFGRVRRRWLALVGVIVIAGLTVFAVYGFEFGPPAERGMIPEMAGSEWGQRVVERLSNFSVPAPGYWSGLGYQWLSSREGHPAFLAGSYSVSGWRHYVIVAFLIKTPLPLLIMLIAAGGVAIARWRRLGRGGITWAVVPALFLIAFLLNTRAIGYRLILPALPFLIMMGAGGVKLIAQHRIGRWALGALCVWQAVACVSIYPDFLAYFNEAVGGPRHGHEYLVDSNLDWGQDLKGLARYVEEHNIGAINLGYFGAADPKFYGLRYRKLPAYNFIDDDLPANAVPEYWAISATTLSGVYHSDTNAYEMFRRLEPVAVIGHSIFIYRLTGEQPE